MKIQRTKNSEYFETVANECLRGREGAVVCINDEPCVWTGALHTLDLAACRRRKLHVGKAIYLGGSIVNMPGDLSICITTWGNSDLAPRIVDRAAEWLAGRGVSIARDENDVLADGAKVISWARATTRKGWCQSVVHFSVGAMDLELVREICTKPLVKTPGALSLYGLTAEMIWNEIEDILKEGASNE